MHNEVAIKNEIFEDVTDITLKSIEINDNFEIKSENIECDPLTSFINFSNNDNGMSVNEESDIENGSKLLVIPEGNEKKNTLKTKNKRAKNKEFDGESLICDLCGKIFPTKIKIIRHIRNVHKSREKVKQKLKEIVNDTPKKIIQSEISENNNNPTIPAPIKQETGFNCPICLKQFMKQKIAIEHIKFVHFEIRLNKNNHNKRQYDYKKLCDICGKYFHSICNYKNHYKKVHFPEQCKTCPYCGKTFITASVLKIHELSHTGERPEECTICDFKCTTKSWLKV